MSLPNDQIEQYILLLKDPDVTKRLSAIEQLGKAGDVRAFNPLLAVVNDEDAPIAVREAAAEALGNLGDRRAVEPLIRLLRDDDERVWTAAAYALGTLGDKASPSLIDALTTDQVHNQAKAELAYALGLTGDARAIPSLVVLLEDQDERVRAVAALGLGRCGEHADNSEPKVVASLLYHVRQDPDADVRESAVAALGNIGAIRARSIFLEILTNKAETDSVRRASAEALANIGGEQAVNALIQVLQDPRNAVRSKAVEGLGRLGDNKAIEPLIAALRDDDASVRWYAASALGALKARQALPALTTIAQNDQGVALLHGKVADAARQAIERIEA